jgi:hypothetical protein
MDAGQRISLRLVLAPIQKGLICGKQSLRSRLSYFTGLRSVLSSTYWLRKAICRCGADREGSHPKTNPGLLV